MKYCTHAARRGEERGAGHPHQPGEEDPPHSLRLLLPPQLLRRRRRMARCHPRRWFYSFHIRSPPPTDPFLIFVSTLIEFPFLLFSFAVYMLQDQEAHAAEVLVFPSFLPPPPIPFPTFFFNSYLSTALLELIYLTMLLSSNVDGAHLYRHQA